MQNESDQMGNVVELIDDGGTIDTNISSSLIAEKTKPNSFVHTYNIDEQLEACAVNVKNSLPSLEPP